MGNIDIFEKMAHHYDSEERIETANLIAGEIRSALVDTDKKRALDYGCGTGLIGFSLLDSFRHILFVDASEQMIKQVRHKLENLPAANADALCCDFSAEPPPQLDVDYIILSQVLLHIKDYMPLLEKLFALLNPAGHLMIVDFDENDAVVSDKVHAGFSKAKLSHALREIGFAHVAAHTFYHGKQIFMNQDASLFLLDAIK